MPAKDRLQQPRKSLRQSLKDLFSGRTKKSNPPSQAYNLQAVGSGILRKADPSISSLGPPQVGHPSLFADAPHYSPSFDRHTTSNAIPNRFNSPAQAASDRLPGRSNALLPARSLSQFHLHDTYLRTSTAPHKPVYHGLSPSLETTAGYEASVSQLTTMSSFSSFSTLRLQDSRHALRQYQSSMTSPNLRSRSPLSTRTTPVPRSAGKHVSWLKSPSNSSVARSTSPSISESLADDVQSVEGPIVEHFKLFCILDTMAPGYPVVMASQQLRYIFKVGEQFFLNNRECEGASMDIVTGTDAAGELITHLVLFSPLIIPSSGRHRFLLACLVDVTRFINDAASAPDLDKASYISSTTESDPRTPLQLHSRAAPGWMSTGYKLSSEDLLGGCVLPEDQKPFHQRSSVTRDDIWLNLAGEERNKASSAIDTSHPTTRIPLRPGSPQAPQSLTTNTTIDEVLDDFMFELQDLYSDFFLLGRSPLSDTYYEICNISPTLHVAKDYIHGHLSHTEPRKMAELSTRLAQGSPFDLEINWGQKGEPKRMYCSPLYGQNSIAWVCFLVDYGTPLLWR